MDNFNNTPIILKASISGERIDIFISKYLNRSRSYCNKLIENRNVLVNGLACKSSHKIKMGEVIQISIPEEKSFELVPEEIPFNIIYEHKRYVVINKPSNMVVHPACGNWNSTLVNGLIYRYGIKFDKEDIRPGIIHRLDKDTSGILIVAKDSEAKEKLSRLFYDKKIKKIYHVVCVGRPSWTSTVIDAPIARHPKNRKIMTVISTGKKATSIVKVIKQFKDVFLAEIELITGRTHQIRVHMKHIGLPVLGDPVYGIASYKNYVINRQALHAYSVSFLDPFDDIFRTFIAPYPNDFKSLLEQLYIE